MQVPARYPVLIGVGIADARAGDDPLGVEAVELMARAAERAVEDAGGAGVAAAIQQIAVPQGTWGYRDPARLVAARLGADGAKTVLVDLGIPQQSLLNETMRAIALGTLDVALVVGGESKAYEARARRAGVEAVVTDQGDAVPDEHRARGDDIIDPAELAARMVVPVESYAVIEQALRTAMGDAPDEHRDRVAELWAAFNEVARSNPEAAFPEPRSAAFIREPGPDNRPLAYPYNKWHATQWTVDQAGALLMCSVEAADRLGVDLDRAVVPLVGLESSVPSTLVTRRELHRWPAMEVLGRAATERLGRPLESLDHFELYSCFPAAVQVQRQALELSPDRIPTITGGMPFAGGPFNNFVLQATVAMAERLRAEAGTTGLVSTVSGFLTKPGLAVWTTDADATAGLVAPYVADLAAEATAATPSVESVPGFVGGARLASYTVTYDDGAPASVVAVGDTPDGRRCAAVATDPELAARGVEDDLVGTAMTVDGPAFRPA